MPISTAADQVAREIKSTVDALLSSRKSFKEVRFSDDDDMGARQTVGPCASVQGLRGVFGALGALTDDRELWALIKPHFSSLMKEWSTVLDEVTSTRYGSGPYETDNVDRLRKEVNSNGSPYTDTVSWTLSTSVLLNYMFPFCRKNGCRVDAELETRTRNEIAGSLRTLINAQVKSGDGGWNWGDSSDLNASHLYFTWSVIQGLADYFDYVVGESEREIGISPDTDTLKYLKAQDAELETDAIKARDRAAQFLRDRYVGTATTSTGLTYSDLVTKDPSGRERIAVKNPGGDIPLLYFYSYLLEALILSSYDKNDPAVVDARRAEMDRLYTEVKRRFALVRPAGAAGTLAADPSTVHLTITGAVAKRDIYVKATVKDPSLWPQILRTLVLYPYYVDTPRYLDEDIVGATGAYAILLGDRREESENVGSHLWDGEGFNLAISVRALEGIIDVYDYVQLMSKQRDDLPKPTADLVEVLAEAIYPHVRIRLRGETEAAQIPAAVPAPMPSDVFIRDIANDVANEQLSINFEGAANLLAERLKTIDLERAVKKVIGERHDSIKNESPIIYDLVRSIVLVSLATTTQLFAEVLQEAILSLAPSKDVAENDRVYKPGPDALSSRITIAVKQIALQEMAKTQNRETWDLAALIKAVLELQPQSPTPPPAPPRQQKRTTA